MTLPAIALLMITALLTLLDWRKGLALAVLVGVAQDPLRKLAPNQPIYYVVLVGAVFGVAWLRAYMQHVKLSPSAIDGWRRDLKLPFTLFVVLVVSQAFHSYVRYGSLLMSATGLLVWLSPIPAVLLAYQFALRRGIAGVRRWMVLYVWIASIALSGVYFEYAGFAWPTLGAVGSGLTIYDVGVALKAYSGFFRSSEIAAWHAASIACFLIMLSIGKRATLVRITTALLLIGVLISLGILTGRRKMLVEIAVFASAYLFLFAWLQRGRARTAVTILVLGITSYVGIVGMMPSDPVQGLKAEIMSEEAARSIRGYAARGQSVFGDIPDRMNELGLQPILWAVNRYGWIGAGLGTGTQGTQDVADAQDIQRGAAEGGLGKVTMELGIPGILMVIWLVVALTGHIRRQLVIATRLSAKHSRMAYGFVAFLIANTATFSVAAQAYSDLFVLLILGWSMGFMLAMPKLAYVDMQRRMVAGTGIEPLGTKGPVPAGSIAPMAAGNA
jgi:hypothetical protein